MTDEAKSDLESAPRKGESGGGGGGASPTPPSPASPSSSAAASLLTCDDEAFEKIVGQLDAAGVRAMALTGDKRLRDRVAALDQTLADKGVDLLALETRFTTGFTLSDPHEKAAHKRETKAVAAAAAGDGALVLGDGETLSLWAGARPSKCFLDAGITEIKINQPGRSVLRSSRPRPTWRPSSATLAARAPTSRCGWRASTGSRPASGSPSWASPRSTVWMKCGRALLDGGLAGVAYIKTPGRDASADNPSQYNRSGYTTKVNFGTADFTSKEAVFAAERAVRKVIGHRFGCGRNAGKLMYKPDVFTQLEIYANNDYGLKPTLYTT